MIQSNPDVDQFSLTNLILQFQVENEGVSIPTVKWLKKQLLLHVSEDIFIADNNGQETIICRRKAGNRIVIKHFQESITEINPLSEEQEHARILKEAATIIINELNKKIFDVNMYPVPDTFFNNLDDYIPESLFTFLRILITHEKINMHDWHKKITAIAHNIISAMFPRKLISPLQLGLAVTLYHRFGSKDLIDILSSLGFCASYGKVLLFQASAIQFQKEPVLQQCFGQFAFDNADHNVCTIDGTFHCMGGIQIIVPHSAIQHHCIPKLNKLPKSHTFIKEGVESIKYFETHPDKRLEDLQFENLK
ncbi:hypothetical protein ALC57_04347 [Trachymyrmex cornetzi]|uniref:Uncharacterized protein n=1 Tax=Trachymyrmex cornetzi TaxID=471704 RepID=A0A151JCU5_9HYME|nr:hypothetical protein ALC57_04347 [Trachymyrmex cornetzi]